MRMERINTNHADGSEVEISLSDVSYYVEGTTILNNLTFDLRSSRIGVVGRNGSGKSSLARLLAGLIAPKDGILSVNGINVAKDRKAALSEVGILFQNPDHQIIFPTVEEEITFGLTQQGLGKQAAKERTDELLVKFGKSHWADAHVGSLSQGQKHLVCLMAIVAMQPKLIILDEPFTGLDIPTKAQLNRYLSRYNGALLHISHDPHDLDGYGQVIWLEAGSVSAIGNAETVLPAYVNEMNKMGGLDDISDLTR